tara:strand:- start:23875 stop:25158 length:1284 start_codon:yes stop_codon:yes gene_type:complete
MATVLSGDQLRFLLNRFRDRLWVKPLVVCLLSVAAVFMAKLAEGTELMLYMPAITADSIETLLSIMASSMLVIATFSVGSMVSAYASASNTATPRSFTLLVADDASQNALSTFVGAFIFSIVALTAFKNNYFETAGLFILFVLTVIAFAVVIVTFVYWVDRIARLGRMGSTIEKVENATAAALKKRRNAPRLRGMRVESKNYQQTVFSTSVGYVQHIDICALQSLAEAADMKIVIAALPGTLAAPGKPLAYLRFASENQSEIDCKALEKTFQIGSTRFFDDDPRFGLVVLSEIAGRALSPAVNDPGTAIAIVGTLLRLFVLWNETKIDGDDNSPEYDRIEVPELSVRDMFDDAFTAIARDSVGMIEVSVRLQKTLHALAISGDYQIQDAAKYHSQLALKRSQLALKIKEDLAAVEDAANFSAGEKST